MVSDFYISVIFNDFSSSLLFVFYLIFFKIPSNFLILVFNNKLITIIELSSVIQAQLLPKVINKDKNNLSI